MPGLRGMIPVRPLSGAAPLIRAQRLSVDYPGTPALKDVSLTIYPGEIVTLVGPNGSGKSTLVRSLLGAITPASGQVTRQAGLRIGYLPQKLALDATLPLTVGRFMNLPGRGLFNAQARQAAEAALARTGASALVSRPLSGLSGGQLQRVLLARALLGSPQLLILDEPTQGLDQPGAAAFYRLIERLRNETGAAILMVSHDLHVVMAASDRVICLNGHICCEGTPSHVAAAPEYRALFGAGTGGALALYRHEHDHGHDPAGEAGAEALAFVAHQHGPGCQHDHGGADELSGGPSGPAHQHGPGCGHGHRGGDELSAGHSGAAHQHGAGCGHAHPAPEPGGGAGRRSAAAALVRGTEGAPADSSCGCGRSPQA